MLLTGFASAAYYIPSDAEIDAWTQQWAEPDSVTATMDPSPAFGAAFDATLIDENFTGFWKAAFGMQYGSWTAGSGLDLSGYDGLKLRITNTLETGDVNVNIFTNDGTGDYTTWGFDEAAWTWIGPGESVWLTIDAAQWDDAANIRKVGFQYATNGPASTNDEAYKGSYIAVQVVPEPATLALLGLGGLLLRKRK
jgi:hypothetical protein